MNSLLLFIIVVFIIGVLWSISTFVKKHGVFDILIGIFAFTAIIGAFKLYRYAKEGYHG